MHHLYLSPHLDDAVYSCGGLIASQARQGHRVTVLTVCAGDPPPRQRSTFARTLEARWGEGAAAMAARREEDRRACRRLGAQPRHLSIPDAIYRQGPGGRFLYDSEEAIFGPLREEEAGLLARLKAELAPLLVAADAVYAPLGVGGHVDHRLTRMAAEKTGTPLTYYWEFPYAARGSGLPAGLAMPEGETLRVVLQPEFLREWQRAAAEYSSQRSTFWSDERALAAEITAYCERNAGLHLLRVP